MENMRMPELRALTRERRLRSYSRLRKAELIAFLQDNAPQETRVHSACPVEAPRRLLPPQMSTWDPRGSQALAGPWEPIDDRLRPTTKATQPEGLLVPCSMELEAPLTRRQLKCR